MRGSTDAAERAPRLQRRHPGLWHAPHLQAVVRVGQSRCDGHPAATEPARETAASTALPACRRRPRRAPGAADRSPPGRACLCPAPAPALLRLPLLRLSANSVVVTVFLLHGLDEHIFPAVVLLQEPVHVRHFCRVMLCKQGGQCIAVRSLHYRQTSRRVKNRDPSIYSLAGVTRSLDRCAAAATSTDSCERNALASA